MKKLVVKKNRLTVDDKIDDLARMMADGFSALQADIQERSIALRTEFNDFRNEMYNFRNEMYNFRNEMYGFRGEMYDFRVSIRRDILKIHDILTDHELRLAKPEE